MASLQAADSLEATLPVVVNSDDGEQLWLDILANTASKVRAYVRRASRDEQEIADLTAETFANAWFRRTEVLSDPNPSTVVIACARQACREWVAAHRREVCLGEVPEPSTPAPDAAVSMSLEEAHHWQCWSIDLLSRLSEKQRLAVDYRYRWSWSYEFVAQAIGSAEATARVHVNRGLRRLRRIIADNPPPPQADGGQLLEGGPS